MCILLLTNIMICLWIFPWTITLTFFHSEWQVLNFTAQFSSVSGHPQQLHKKLPETIKLLLRILILYIKIWFFLSIWVYLLKAKQHLIIFHRIQLKYLVSKLWFSACSSTLYLNMWFELLLNLLSNVEKNVLRF